MRSKAMNNQLKTAVLAGAGLLLATSVSSAADVYLRAESFNKSIDGNMVPMWGYASCDSTFATCDPPQVPGPQINVAATDTLTIHLRNTLTTPVSVVVPGQPGGGDPVMEADGRGRPRVRSLTHETDSAPSADGVYTWSSLRPGTYLYESGTRQSIQVPMGLYGALIVGPATGVTCSSGQPAYDTYDADGTTLNENSCYDSDAVLLFSEVDPVQNQRVDDALNLLALQPTTQCETLSDWELASEVTSNYPCTIDYNPSWVLVNGTASTAAAPVAISAGTASQDVLLRMLNAGLRSHSAAIVGLELGQIAEDGNPHPGLVKYQAEAPLPAGKTRDVLATMPSTVNATYPLFDRMSAASAAELPASGMLAYLNVGGGATPPGPATVYAVDDTVVDIGAFAEDGGSQASAASVLANDVGLAGATVSVVSEPANGTLAMNPDGTFNYTPKGDFSGVDGFTYSAMLGGISYPAHVALNVSFMNDVPVANPDSYANGSGTSLSVSGSAGVLGNDSDLDGDTLTAVLDTPPAGGGLTLYPDGSFDYDAVAGGYGMITFDYHAFDGSASSAVATVTLTMTEPNGPMLTVVDPDGTPVTEYRWIVQEDVMFHNDPLVPAALSDTQSLNFHKSYMRPIAQGCVGVVELGGCPDPMINPVIPNIGLDAAVLDPTTHYYVSVLPNDATDTDEGTGDPIGHSIGGAQIPPGATEVTVVVNKQPIPTAQISVLVFEDNNPTNGAPDGAEAGLQGYNIIVEDAGGRYGASGGHQLEDAFGNELVNSLGLPPPYGEDCFAAAGMDPPPLGVITTCPDGRALIKDLPPGKYGIIAVPPGDKVGTMVQTSTIEGSKVIDAWVKAGGPELNLEFAAALPHAFIGFVDKTTESTTPGHSISGRVTLFHDPRPPGIPSTLDSDSYIGFSHTRALIGLNDSAGGGPLVAVTEADEDGYFTLDSIPDGLYQLVIWDTYLDQIIAFQTVDVAGGDVVLPANIAVNAWFTRTEHNVFLDDGANDCDEADPGNPGVAGDAIRQPCEVGMPEQAVLMRWRDGTVNQEFPTDLDGFVPFDQAFPFFSWQVLEIDYTRFKPTGVTVTVDGGGDVTTGPYPGLLQPQIQDPSNFASNEACTPGTTIACMSRTETGSAVLLEAYQGFPGQTSVFNWGKMPYEPGENGGISGIVYYASTRGENDPRLTAGDPWEPGIPGVTVRLYREVAIDGGGVGLSLVDEVQTDSWDDSLPEGCPGEDPTSVYVTDTLGPANVARCYDGWRNFNQVRPGVFDGGYAFNDIPAGTYVVEVVPPPGYELYKEEDVNVGFGDVFEMVLPGPMAPAAIPADYLSMLAATEQAGLTAVCVGETRVVPMQLSLFPDESPYGGTERPLCDRKRVILEDQGQAAADFHLFTSTPVAAQFTGLVLDDLTNEPDPASPSYGEKWAPAYVPIAIRDFLGREVYRTLSDPFGRFNGVLPSTWTANLPMPSGYSPAMMSACMNDLGDVASPDPNYLALYGTACYTSQFMPGTTTYLDTPILPTAAFAGGFNQPDCACEDGTPKIASVRVVEQGGGFPELSSGPLVATGGILEIRSAGDTVEVPNPAYEGPWATAAPYNQPTITRDFGFGAGGGPNRGTVWLIESDGTAHELTTLNGGNGWNPNRIRAIAPNTEMTGELVVIRGDDDNEGKTSINSVTVTVSNSETPIRVAAGGSIQDAIDDADPGDLILVEPGTYEEQVIMWKSVRLQGSGSDTIINATQFPQETLQPWIDKIAMLVADGDIDLVPNTPADLIDSQGAGITVVAGAGDGEWPAGSRIDGFTITGASGGGGIFVNGYAHGLEISNNAIEHNSGFEHGGIGVGHSFLPDVDLLADEDGVIRINNNLNIHHNAITLNGAQSETSAGGGIGLFSGSFNYTVANNYICGNYATGYGGGISHLGQSHGGLIANNWIIFNQSREPDRNPHGGGIFLAGEPTTPPALTLGTGDVTVDANLIQGNNSGAGSGGGIRTQFVNGIDADPEVRESPWLLQFTNNMIVNNVAAYAGGGISLHDTINAEIIGNTIANNDSTATVGGVIINDMSEPQPAGISAEPLSLSLTGLLGEPNAFSDPLMVNNIVWHNRAFHYELAADPVMQPAPGAPLTAIGECFAGATYWDLGVLGEPMVGPARTLNPIASILTDRTGYDASNLDEVTDAADPGFVDEYCNGARTLSTPGPMLGTPAFEEGGNFVDVRYGPLARAWDSVAETTETAPWDYHILEASDGVDNGNDVSGVVNMDHDFDGDSRPEGTFDIGADELVP